MPSQTVTTSLPRTKAATRPIVDAARLSRASFAARRASLIRRSDVGGSICPTKRHRARRDSGLYEGAVKQLRVDIWSDVVCPWCYVGKRRFETAVRQFVHGDAVDVVWRAFELDSAPTSDRPQDLSYAQQLAAKYQTTLPRAEQMIRMMTSTAEQEGLEFHFERVRAGNTFDAHRVLHLASARSVQDAVNERFMRGFMTEGCAVEPEVLVRLAVDAGLDEQETRAVLATDVYGDDVRADEEEAQAIGINGVPFFVLGARYAVAGAQPAEILVEAMRRAWESINDVELEAEPVEGALPDGCA